MAAAVGPRMVQNKAIRIAAETRGLRRKLNRSFSCMGWARRYNDRIVLVVSVVRAVILIVLKLRTHLFFQMVLLSQLVLGLVNLALKTVTGVVADEVRLRGFRGAFAGGLFFDLS